MKSFSLAKAILLPAAMAAIFGCAGLKPKLPDLESPESCTALVKENAYIPGSAPTDSFEIEKKFSNRCYSEHGAYMIARKRACDSGYALASLINIQRPGIWSGPCYLARVQLYRDTVGMKISESPILSIDSVSLKGLSLALKMNIGTVFSGIQSESGLVSEKGDTATTSKAGVGVEAIYYPLNFIGLGIHFKALWSSATAPDTKSMSLINQYLTGGFVEVPIWKWQRIQHLYFPYARVGLSYTKLQLADEYADFFEKNTQIEANRDFATGMAWNITGGFRTISVKRYFLDIAVDYLVESPKFPHAHSDFDGKSILFGLGAGYKF